MSDRYERGPQRPEEHDGDPARWPFPPELRREVDALVTEVQAAVHKVAPLLSEAMRRLVEVDALACGYAEAAESPHLEDERYEMAQRMSGADRLCDVLQDLSVRCDVYAATEANRPSATR